MKSITQIVLALCVAAAALLTAPAAFAAENTLTVQVIDINGLDVSLSAANTDGSQFQNPSNERVMLICQNTNGSTRNVVAETQQATLNVPGYGTVTLSDQTSVVPATTGLTLIGPFPAAQFNDSSGYAHVTFSAVSGLSCAAVSLTRPSGG